MQRFGMICISVLFTFVFASSQMGGCGSGGSSGGDGTPGVPATPKAIAFIHNAGDGEVDATSLAFRELIEAWGWATALISVEDVSEINTDEFALIIIGGSSGSLGNWGKKPHVEHIMDLGLPVLAIGVGGASFHSQAGLSTGWMNSALMMGQSAVMQNVIHPFFTEPNSFGQDGPLFSTTLFVLSDEQLRLGMNVDLLDESVEILARDSAISEHATLTLEAERFCYWAYYTNPETWTDTGRAVFENVITYLMSLE